MTNGQVAGQGGERQVVVYTIGHGRHPLEEFLALLARHGVQVLVDVRSQPYSRWAPQFNRESLSRAMEQAGLTYHFAGDGLGGRPADPAMYTDGGERPDYTRMAASPSYVAALTSLLALAGRQTVAIMCSEGDYRRCHRHLLIAPTLLERGARVLHIQPDGATTEEGSQPQQLSLFG